MTAIYSGDGNFKGSTSSTWTQVVGEKVATTTTLSSTVSQWANGGSTSAMALRMATAHRASPAAIVSGLKRVRLSVGNREY